MKTNSMKKLYEAPELTRICMDNEISLALESPTASPPSSPWGSDSHYEPTNSYKLPIT